MVDADERLLPSRVRALPEIESSKVDGHKLSAPGCDVLFIRGSAGTYLPAHTHDTENVTLIASGAVTVTTDAGAVTYRPGEWYHSEPGEPHSIRFDEDTVQVELRFAAGDR